MKTHIIVATGLVAAIALLPSEGAAKSPQSKKHSFNSSGLFQKVATFDVMAGNGSSVAEIIDTTYNGKQLIYTDSENGAIGFVDISNPARPKALGTVDVGGEPTSLVVRGFQVLVGINTSESYAAPSGQLVVVNLWNRKIATRHELGGQPDSIALAPDYRRAAIVIENERDEELDLGLGEGVLPQNETGKLLIVNLRGRASRWQITEADLSPVAAAAYAGSDLEPEFVDINSQNEAVVTFQENNHIAIVDMETGRVINQFPAGEVELNNIDNDGDDRIQFESTIVRRAEPDAVAWIDNDSFATANEGDYEDENGVKGGSRGFTIFNQNGTVEFESAESFEHLLASAGHYNEGRSSKKGCEPESVETGVFGKTSRYGKANKARTLLFVGSERANAVAVYNASESSPELLQILPTGIGPEGLKAIPHRNLFVASTEKDEADAGIPTMINIYQTGYKTSAYPMIQSINDDSGTPIPWVALSGLASDLEDANKLYAVSDSFLAEGFIYAIDVSSTPAKIFERMQVTGASESLDLEGIAVGPDGDFWLASEGNPGTRPNLILKVHACTGAVISEIALPAELADTTFKNGFEGIAATGEAGEERIYVAIQRAWTDKGDTAGAHTKIGRYTVKTGEWDFVYYPLEAEGNGGWVGLSELTELPNGTFAVIERDKGWGPTTGLNAELKAIYGIDLAAAEFRAYGEELATLEKNLLYDVLPELADASIWTTEKLEGLAVAADGQVYAVSDNDGVDEATGETIFLRFGDCD